jgi:glutamate synthase domain-containing protein 2
LIEKIGKKFFYAVLVAWGVAQAAWLLGAGSAWMLLVLTALMGVGVWDLTQKQHAIRRNFPLLGHLRYLLEDIGPELNQYFVEGELNGRPFNRDQRSLIYQRAKDVVDTQPYGTQLDLYAPDYVWINHSIAPADVIDDPARNLRLTIGNESCTKPYSASIFNISAMSFGSLGANATTAMNWGARLGGFAQDTGEGGISRYHRMHGGDLIWEIGSGYFGCRRDDGGFDPDRFAEQARDDQVKMIELKLSQGAKPGHGGMLPAAKISPEIAQARGVPLGQDCISPARHAAFSNPTEMLEFLAQLRELSGGKPVGFKLCVGHPVEVMAICKAMLATGIAVDFIVVDGAEGGTGAAPQEFSDHTGAPLREGLMIVQNALVGSTLRDQISIGAAGKIVSGFDIALVMSMGADWANAARGFMLAAGCIQSLRCNLNDCPVGVATNDPALQRGLVVEDKAQRVDSFHRGTVEAMAELIGAAGLKTPWELGPHHILLRTQAGEVHSLDHVYDFVDPGALLERSAPGWLNRAWRLASADRFVGA